VLVLVYCYYSLPQENRLTSFYGEYHPELPSVTIAGASNLVYNYDFEWLNANNDNYNFIGCYLNEPSGLLSTLNKCRNLDLKENDILVLCLPYSFYESDKFLPFKNELKIGYSKKLFQEALTNFPYYTLKNINNISLLDLGKIAKQGKPTSDTQNQFELIPPQHTDSLYQTCWTNSEDNFAIKSNTFDEAYMRRIFESLKTMFHCKILFRFPVVKEGEYVLNEERIKFMEANFNCINKFDDSIYPHKFWYNQWYHLNACGAKLCSDKLIKELNLSL